MRNDRKIRDAKIQNSRRLRQELLTFTEQEPLIESITIEAIPNKCIECDKWTIYGKTCQGICTKRSEEVTRDDEQ